MPTVNAEFQLSETASRIQVNALYVHSDSFRASITGSLEIVKDQTERTEAIRAIVETGTGNLSANFVAVHGFKKEDGWSSITPDKPMIIVKLAKVTERIGLKSP